MPRKLHQIFPYFVLISMGMIISYLTWPGFMSPDSHGQYAMALSGQYGDHHPPMMSVVWGFLDGFYKGPGLMLIGHLLLLYSASAIFIFIFQSSPLKWLYVFLPVFPHILVYAQHIWKDVGFAFCYLLSSAILSYCSLTKKNRPSLFIITLILLFYGSTVKFQAIYVLPIFLLWIAFLVHKSQLNIQSLLTGVLMYIMFFFAIQKFNNHFVPENKKEHGWQYVKLYDLAAISTAINHSVFPEFIEKNPNFSMEKIKTTFNHIRVDDMVFAENAPLMKGDTLEKRKVLLTTWYREIAKHPLIYLTHRCKNIFNLVTAEPLAKFESRIDIPSEKLILLLNVVRHFLRYVFLLPFILLYFVLGIVCLKKTRAAIPLFFMNTTNLIFLSTIFFFSMASALRYAYITICLVHASHAFAYICYKSLQKNKDLTPMISL